MHVQSLRIYPLKAAKGLEVPSCRILERGLERDRSFVLVDKEGRFISQRQLSCLARLGFTIFDGESVRLQMDERELSLMAASGGLREVVVWGDKVLARDWGEEAARFLLEQTGQELRLCEAIETSPRKVKSLAAQNQEVPFYFADAYPFLIISQESLDDLNDRLKMKGLDSVSMDRFRPNIVIEGWSPFGEDRAKRLRIGKNIELTLNKACKRCLVITIDQEKGIKGREPLETLAEYRNFEGSINFGQNAYLTSKGGEFIHQGDPVEILE